MKNVKVKFEAGARKEMAFFERHNKILFEKIIVLIEDIKLHPYSGLGKPEALKNSLSGYWSRRINKEHRLVYKVEGNTIIIIASCRFHY